MSKIIQFFKEVKGEFKNITWPKKETLIQLTIVVISISIIISLLLGGFDYIFTQGLSFLSKSKTNSVKVDSTEIQPTIESTPSAIQIATPSVEQIKK